MEIKKGKWKKQFSEWFSDIISEAEILDYRYPLKGCGVWQPYGFQIRKNTLNIIKDLLDGTGHNETLFPLLIPDNIFAKEAIHVKGFEEEVYWVTHGGLTELDVKLALRPTSETAMYPMFAKWIRSHADMPLKVYQAVSVFRYETKATKPLIRVREITTFKEAHTAHATWDDAERQVKEGVEVYSKFFEKLGIPFIISKRPEWDKFPGAVYTLAFDTLTPDRRSLQVGTVHNLGQTFAKTFEIEFETKDGGRDFAYQTCYGISERIIAALIAVHGDDGGLKLPPSIAPIQIIVIPITFKGKEKEVMGVSDEIYKWLKEAGFRVKKDDSDIKPGKKFYFWEMKGVPLRVEIGPIDAEKKQLTYLRRDTMEKGTIQIGPSLFEDIKNILDQIQDNLAKVAQKNFSELIKQVKNLAEAKKLLETELGIVQISWCGEKECALELEEKVGVGVLGTPIDEKWKIKVTKCPICDKKGVETLILGKAY
ncbi:MAG: proline--tRNA ligase [Candidatus Hodarchaeota archaeon]